ncbi:aldo/keto reductase, partial [Candidatus Poribacteria bacterium]|nr:aldo/keto reductase [Candidatus Poribacteria bacterium]
VFTDSVRAGWNRGESGRPGYEAMLARLAAVREALGSDADLVETALRFLTSHESNPVAIPGATRPSQAVSNAAAGAALLDAAEYQKLRAM